MHAVSKLSPCVVEPHVRLVKLPVNELWPVLLLRPAERDGVHRHYPGQPVQGTRVHRSRVPVDAGEAERAGVALEIV